MIEVQENKKNGNTTKMIKLLLKRRVLLRDTYVSYAKQVWIVTIRQDRVTYFLTVATTLQTANKDDVKTSLKNPSGKDADTHNVQLAFPMRTRHHLNSSQQRHRLMSPTIKVKQHRNEIVLLRKSDGNRLKTATFSIFIKCSI